MAEADVEAADMVAGRACERRQEGGVRVCACVFISKFTSARSRDLTLAPADRQAPRRAAAWQAPHRAAVVPTLAE